jgi:hypothetical protein
MYDLVLFHPCLLSSSTNATTEKSKDHHDCNAYSNGQILNNHGWWVIVKRSSEWENKRRYSCDQPNNCSPAMSQYYGSWLCAIVAC